MLFEDLTPGSSFGVERTEAGREDDRFEVAMRDEESYELRVPLEGISAVLPMRPAHEVVTGWAFALPGWREALIKGKSSDNELTEVLSLGAVGHGITTESRVWMDAIRELAGRINAARGDVVSPLKINVVFHVPGHLTEIGFSGIRTGRSSRSGKSLMVEVALPENPPGDPVGYLTSQTSEALNEAEQRVAKHHVDLQPQRSIMEGV